MSKKYHAILVASISFLILLATTPLAINKPVTQAVKSSTSYLASDYSVLKVDDGDTITIDMNGATEKVRFIGVDTPETKDPRKAVQCFGREAAKFTNEQIRNQRVRLEADELNTNRDRYNRLLRYIYLPNGLLLNAEIIKQGYGFAYTSFPFTKKDQFKQFESDARASNRGLWGICQPKLNKYDGYTSNDE